MARLILIRHGESVANAEGRFTWGPDEPLTERGMAEARACGVELRRRFHPVALYASPYARALDTARLVGEAFDLDPQVVEDLRERSFGRFRGQPYATYVPRSETSIATWWSRRPPGGESLCEVVERAGPALDSLALQHLGQDVVVVSHGGVMAALKGYATQDFDSPPVPPPNTAGYVLLYTADGYEGPVEVLHPPEIAVTLQ